MHFFYDTFYYYQISFYKSYIYFGTSFQHIQLLSVIPEIFLVFLVLVLILHAVSATPDQKVKLIIWYHRYSVFLYGILIIISLEVRYQLSIIQNFTIHFYYDTLIINYQLAGIKTFILFCSLCCLFSYQYFMQHKLNKYEYPLFINLATVGILVAITANNWVVLFLALELQALCLLILFAWDRKSEVAVISALKFICLNFIASTLILLGFIEIIIHTQKVTISIFMPNYISIINAPWKELIMVKKQLSTYISVWPLASFLILLGFSIKLGMFPFGLWLQELYSSTTIPVLLFFFYSAKSSIYYSFINFIF